MKFSFIRNNWKFFAVLILIILITFISYRGANNPIKSSVLFVANPLLRTFHGFSDGLKGLFDFLGSIGRLKEDNERLIKENLELKAQVAKFGDTANENELLRQQLGLLPKDKYTLESSLVIAQDSLGSTSSVLIDKGRNYGIESGMPVIISNGILVGKVGEAFENSARVTLATDQKSAVNGEVLESGAKGIVAGTYGLGLEMNMISQTEVIKEEDTVISSGLGGGMPRGLFMGRIGQVSQSEDKLFQRAILISSIDLSSLRVVFVIKKF